MVTYNDISDLMPHDSNPTSLMAKSQQAAIDDSMAKERAKALFQEKRKMQENKEKVEYAEAVQLDTSSGIVPEDLTKEQIEKIAHEQKMEKAITDMELSQPAPISFEPTQNVQEIVQTASQVKRLPNLTHSDISKSLSLQGAARADVVKLLNSLNINLNVQLTKSDTANLLACLLTCNETQLNALLTNTKVPIVIKTVIRRLLTDVQKGDMATIEKLWDRVFGKGAMSLELPEQTLAAGLIPNTPVSREAYIVIRDTLMK